MTLLEELWLEIWKDGQSCLECKDLAIEDHIVPYATSKFEVDVFYEYCDEPVCQKEGCVDLQSFKVLVQFGQHLLKVAVEEINAQLDILDVAQEKLDEKLFVDKVGETNESTAFLQVHKKGSGQKTHVLIQRNNVKEEIVLTYLYIADIWPVD